MTRINFPLYLRPLMLRLRALGCVAAIATSLCAQSLHPRAILELNACGNLQVFEDGTVLESRDGKKTERRLSESRMRRLRQVIAGAPCPRNWAQSPPAPLDVGRIQSVPFPRKVSDDDCNQDWLSAGIGLLEVKVTLHHQEQQVLFPVYILCDAERKAVKAWAKRTYKGVLKRNWQRFLDEVVSAVGGKSVLKGCNCRQS
jgi:hypothetical protein